MKRLGKIGHVLAAGGLIGIGFSSALYLAEPPKAEPPRAELHGDISLTVGSVAIRVNSAFVVPSYLPKRIDNLPLAFDVNTMKPARPLTPNEYFSAPNILLVTLLAPDETRSPAERKAEYFRFRNLAAEHLHFRRLAVGSNPSDSGLIRREVIRHRFSEASLYLSPPDGDLFAAICFEGDSSAGILAVCTAYIHAGDVDVTMRFERSRLAEWESLTAYAVTFVSGLKKAAEAYAQEQARLNAELERLQAESQARSEAWAREQERMKMPAAPLKKPD